jgi:hypothetical protein
LAKICWLKCKRSRASPEWLGNLRRLMSICLQKMKTIMNSLLSRIGIIIWRHTTQGTQGIFAANYAYEN